MVKGRPGQSRRLVEAQRNLKLRKIKEKEDRLDLLQASGRGCHINQLFRRFKYLVEECKAKYSFYEAKVAFLEHSVKTFQEDAYHFERI